MNKGLFKINLQLFAGDDVEFDIPDGIEDLETEEDVIEVDVEDLEDETENISQDDTAEVESKSKQPRPDSKDNEIIRNAVIAERKKWKKRVEELEAKLNSIKDTTIEETEADDLDKQLAELGFDEKTIKILKSKFNKTQNEAVTVKKLVQKKFRDLEFKELAKDPLFSDIDLYRDELEEFMDKTGLSAEEAYLAKFGKNKITKSRADIEREVEQRVLANLKKKQDMVFDSTDNGEVGTNKKRFRLSKDEMELAKLAGMTPQEYYFAKHSKSIDQLNKILKKKG
ncbi:MAG TPA: hypothetical protein PLH43_11935 [Acetivibrio sp.]|uniref:hypothetical protein n=1 Tax=Acetivibrio sp. TaxID=1872092 RepID=UPI002C7F4FBD|nr:hypothetical protein [Acetivibrio sp.]HOM03515.1 hypothetical protein [Acetivibrio sp.]